MLVKKFPGLIRLQFVSAKERRRFWKKQGLGVVPDREIARRIGYRTVTAVRTARLKMKIPPARRGSTPHHLGTLKAIILGLLRRVPTPWRKLLPAVREDYGHVAEGVVRRALRALRRTGKVVYDASATLARHWGYRIPEKSKGTSKYEAPFGPDDD